MKKLLFTVLLAATSLSLSAQGGKPFTIPEVGGWEASEGTFTPTGRVVYPKKDKAAETVAKRLTADAQALTGLTLTPVAGRGRDGDIVVRSSSETATGSEGYRLSIGRTAEISAATETGLYYGTRTLLQLMEQSVGGSLPCGTALDRPQYAHRGFMIDCGRKYIPMAYLRQLVRIMGYYKMNVLQVHLNDNGFKQFFGGDWEKTQAAFRLECDTYAGLTARDGSYTKREFRELCALAKECGVEIIPEIDVPAHSLAFTHYRPSLGSKRFGADHLDLGNPEVYTFLDALFDEYLSGDDPVFSHPKVCIGTDEYSNADKNVVEQFRAFTDHYIRLVERYGKTCVVWGALTHAKGDTPVKADGVVMNCWYNGFAAPRDMKDLGYKLVSIPDGLVYIVPAAGYYYDYLPIERLYNTWTPARIGAEQFEECDSSLLGGMFAVWNDHAGNGISTKDIHHRLMPAMQTLAAKCWSGATATIPYAEWDSLRHRLSEAPDVNESGRAKGFPERSQVLTLDTLRQGGATAFEEIGWDYTVSFTVDAQPEEKGTVLLKSANARFYLSDPVEGKVGFSRDGYLDTFDYRLPPSGRVTITVQGTADMVRLLVDGKKRGELKRETLYVAGDAERYKPLNDDAEDGSTQLWQPQVYRQGSHMYRVHTLVFPLRTCGNFQSTVTGLSVWNYLRE